MKPILSAMTSKINCGAAVINTRSGRPLSLVRVQNTAPRRWSRSLPGGRGLSRAHTHTHTKAAGLPQFPTRKATWHGESRDRRTQSVPKLQVCFCVYFWKGLSLHKINKRIHYSTSKKQFLHMMAELRKVLLHCVSNFIFNFLFII